jgi:hypothetical protein
MQTEYNGALYESLCEIISEITGVKVVIPKNFKKLLLEMIYAI